MKKAIFFLILLILAGGAAVYFGWVNIEPGYFGIAHSTLTGTVPYPLESGKIHWFWQKLVPKSFHLYEVENRPRSLSLESTYYLPGSEQLQEFGSFDLVIGADLQYRLDFSAAALLIEMSLLDGFEEHLKREITAMLDEVVSGFMLDNMIRHSQYDAPIRYDSLDRLEEYITERIRNTTERFKLADAEWEIAFKKIPQLDLYNEALNQYFTYLDAAYRHKEEELERESVYLSRAKENELEVDRWEKYGELIRKYPELLKYFYIEKFSGQADVLVLPQNESTGFPKMLEPWEPLLSEPTPRVEQPPSAAKPSAPQEGAKEVEPVEKPAERQLETQETRKEEMSEDGKKWYEMLMFWKRADADR